MGKGSRLVRKNKPIAPEQKKSLMDHGRGRHCCDGGRHIGRGVVSPAVAVRKTTENSRDDRGGRGESCLL